MHEKHLIKVEIHTNTIRSGRWSSINNHLIGDQVMTSCNCLLFAIMKISHNNLKDCLWQVSLNSFKHGTCITSMDKKIIRQFSLMSAKQGSSFLHDRICAEEKTLTLTLTGRTFSLEINFAISLMANLLNLNSAYYW